MQAIMTAKTATAARAKTTTAATATAALIKTTTATAARAKTATATTRIKDTSKRALSLILAVMLATTLAGGLFVTAPKEAHALNAPGLRSEVDNFDPGGEGKLTATLIGTSILRITGEVTGATNTLVLDIDTGTTVRWEASYTGSANGLIELSGSGIFEVLAGGLISGSGTSVIDFSASSVVSVRVSGGIVRNTMTAGGIAISGYNLPANNNTITITGGEVSSANGRAIAVSGNVTVSGGTVSAGGLDSSAAAIEVFDSASHTITVSSGTVSAQGGFAIVGSSATTVTISGNGFVFAWGTSITGNSDAVIAGGTINITGNAVVCAWNKPSETPTYIQGSSNDLIVNSGAGAAWISNAPPPSGPPGISYKNLSDTASYFFPISGVTVSPLSPITYIVTVVSGTANPTSAPAGTTVTIIASPAPSGKVFDKWTANIPGVAFASETSATTTFTMPASSFTVTATYKDAPVTTYPVTVVSGTANPANAAANTTVTITATAAPAGKVFDTWVVNVGGVTLSPNPTSATATFAMPAGAVTVTATYKDAPVTTYPVTVVSGTGGGNYAAGVTVTITASPAPAGKVFDRWTSSDGVIFASATSASTTFTMPAKAVAVTATYVDLPLNTYAVNVATTGGSGTANANPSSAAAGATITLTATPASGYRFVEWQVVSGGMVITDDSFVMPAANVTITAVFEAIPGWIDPNDPNNSNDPNDPNDPSGDAGNLTWLWISLGALLLVAAVAGGVTGFVFIRKRKVVKLAKPSAQAAIQPATSPAVLSATPPVVQPATPLVVQPAAKPAVQPAAKPAAKPAGQVAGQPTVQPPAQPTAAPATQPATQPTVQQPPVQPTAAPAAPPIAQQPPVQFAPPSPPQPPTA